MRRIRWLLCCSLMPRMPGARRNRIATENHRLLRLCCGHGCPRGFYILPIRIVRYAHYNTIRQPRGRYSYDEYHGKTKSNEGGVTYARECAVLATGILSSLWRMPDALGLVLVPKP